MNNSNFTLKIPGKILFSLAIVTLLLFQGWGQEQEIQRAKLYRDVFPLISDSDLYCSFFIMEEVNLDTRIIGSEREAERMLMREHDIFYINKGSADGIEIGQVFLILEIGPKINKYGHLALKRGRAQVVAVEEKRASLRLEKSCEQVMTGYYLVPFEEKASFLGKDLGYDIPVEESEGLEGSIIYTIREYNQIGRGHWALIDLGEEDGVRFGQQLVIYRGEAGEEPVKVIGNLIVIDVQRKTSTVKILSGKDTLKVGDKVQPHFK